MNILCVCPIGIGNYLLCYPAFDLLRESMPSASLHLLALREGIAQLARADSLWSGVTVFDPGKLSYNPVVLYSTFAALRKHKFDASLNFFPSNTWHYHLLPWLTAIPNRYAFRYPVAPWSKLSMLSNRFVSVDEGLHDVHQNYRLVNLFLGADHRPSQPRFPVLFTEADRQWASDHFRTFSSSSLRIGIHPGSSVEHGMGSKRWQSVKFARLIDSACRYLNAEAYIFGGPDEETVKREVASAMECTVHVVAPTSLARTAALLAHCTLCICNDSGLMHMAACQGIPTAGIFGPTDEKRNGPFGPKTLVIRKHLKGFPVWTARNVGDRTLPKGIDPAESLNRLDPDDAWRQLRPWIETIMETSIAPHPSL